MVLQQATVMGKLILSTVMDKSILSTVMGKSILSTVMDKLILSTVMDKLILFHDDVLISRHSYCTRPRTTFSTNIFIY